MRSFGFALAGLVLGGTAAVVFAVAAAMIADISQAEGAYAMGVAFFWVPLGALLGLILGIVLARRR